MGRRRLRNSLYVLSTLLLVSNGNELAKDEVDKVIEDEITQKLSTDLLQSIEKKFQVDLERSVDMVLVKIRRLLQNGTYHIQDKLAEIQGILEVMKKGGETAVEECLTKKQNETSALAEKALHQMVVCGYALIGQDPGAAVTTVVKLKHMIKETMKPIYEQKPEIYGLLKVCGHQHDALRKVVQCVISKSSVIKSVMMEITERLVKGVVDLTKLIAHGAMHEACLIEVVRTVEEEVVDLLRHVAHCTNGTDAYTEEFEKFIASNNATVLDIKRNVEKANESQSDEINDLLRRMFAKGNTEDIDKRFKDKLMELQLDANSVLDNSKDAMNKDK